MSLLAIHPENPQERLINQVVDTLKKGGIIIYPTDTVYAMGCLADEQKSIERLCQIKGIKAKEARFAMICKDLKQIADHAKLEDRTFKLMKKAFPGPYTFIVKAHGTVAKLLNPKKKEVGIRIPDNIIVMAILEKLDSPLVTTSLKSDDVIVEYPTDPEEIMATFGKTVDIVIDGGPGNNVASTVIDCTDDDNPTVVRDGAGSADMLL